MTLILLAIGLAVASCLGTWLVLRHYAPTPEAVARNLPYVIAVALVLMIIYLLLG